MLGMSYTPEILALRRWSQEDWEFMASFINKWRLEKQQGHPFLPSLLSSTVHNPRPRGRQGRGKETR